MTVKAVLTSISALGEGGVAIKLITFRIILNTVITQKTFAAAALNIKAFLIESIISPPPIFGCDWAPQKRRP
jgi:hypothetical protein